MAVIVDIDGTLLFNGTKPMKRMVEWVNSQDAVYIVTARPEAARASTVEALRRAGIQYNRLLMNSIGRSHAEGLESKRRHAKDLKSKVSLAVDNDADARRVYESEGIKTSSPSIANKFNWTGSFIK
jgi:hypothetical protein